MGIGIIGKGECLGVDIGSQRTKVVHLKTAAGGPRVEAAFAFETPPECVAEAVVTDPGRLAELLKAGLEEHGVTCENGVAAVAGAQVTVREAHMPKMPEKLIGKSVRYEAARYISIPVEEATVEYELLGRSAEGIDVLLVAAPTKLVESRTEVLLKAGLTPLAVDLEAFALYRALVEASPDAADDAQTIVLLDLGAAHTDLNIVRGGTFVLSRSLAICGNSMTEAIAPMVGGDLKAAEELKLAADLELAKGAGDSDSDQARAVRAIRRVLDEIAKEVRRSINYYKESAERPEQTGVDKLLISGGGALVRGLAPFFESNLEIPCSVGDPFGGSGSGDLPGAVLATALGLAQKELIQARVARLKAA